MDPLPWPNTVATELRHQLGVVTGDGQIPFGGGVGAAHGFHRRSTHPTACESGSACVRRGPVDLTGPNSRSSPESFMTPDAALTSHFPLRRAVELSCQSVLRHETTPRAGMP